MELEILIKHNYNDCCHVFKPFKTPDIQEFLLAMNKQNHSSVCTMARTVQFII